MNKRPFIPNAVILDNTKHLEKFQNLTLRPIIKSLNGLLLNYFLHYTVLKKNDFSNASKNEKTNFITTAFLNDNQFKNEVRGIIIGHFSIEEYNFYKKYTKQLNKRITSIVKQRFLSY